MSQESCVSFPGNYPDLVQSNEPPGEQTEHSGESLVVSSQFTQVEELIDPPGGRASVCACACTCGALFLFSLPPATVLPAARPSSAERERWELSVTRDTGVPEFPVRGRKTRQSGLLSPLSLATLPLIKRREVCIAIER